MSDPASNARSSVDLLGVALYCQDLDASVREVQRRIQHKHGGYACFVNVHTLVESISNPHLRAALTRATYCFPDGLPLVWLSRVRRPGLAGRICGPDFTDSLMKRERRQLQGLIGGLPGVAEAVAERLKLHSIEYAPPVRPFSVENALDDWRTFLSMCPNFQPPAVVWVGLGAPKQELWVHAVSPHAPGTTFLAVGAAFDFLAGTKTRAPKWVQQAGLEWAHRLVHEPRRLWRRYLITNLTFAFLALHELARLALSSIREPIDETATRPQ